jgi:hypothetical protein
MWSTTEVSREPMPWCLLFIILYSIRPIPYCYLIPLGNAICATHSPLLRTAACPQAFLVVAPLTTRTPAPGCLLEQQGCVLDLVKFVACYHLLDEHHEIGSSVLRRVSRSSKNNTQKNLSLQAKRSTSVTWSAYVSVSLSFVSREPWRW